MDLSLQFESFREGIKHGMRREPQKKKYCVACGGFFTLICSLILGSFQMSSWGNTLVIQNNFNNTQLYNKTFWENSTYYDIQFLFGPFEDEEQAAALNLTLNATLTETEKKKGCQWSTIYAFAGFVLVLLACNAVLLVLGGWFYQPRAIGMFCHSFLTLINLVAVIITYRFRFRDQGKLAAMSTMPSRTDGDNAYDLSWTYQDDAKYIEKIFIWQSITLFLCLITSNFGCSKLWNSNRYLKDSQMKTSLVPSGSQLMPSNQH